MTSYHFNKRILVVGLMVIGLTLFTSTSAVFAQVADAVSPATAPSQTSTVAETAKTSDTISLDFKDADINTVLRILSMKSGVNIVAGPEVKGSITLRLDNVPWEKALQVILRTYDYVYDRDGNIIRVTTRDRMQLEPVETKAFILNYSKAQEIQSAIQDILTERGRVRVADRTNMLVVTDIPSNLYKIGEVIKNLDKVTPQAYIDSKVVRTEAGAVENMGISWDPQASLSGAARPTTFPFSAIRDKGSAFPLKTFFPITTQDTATLPVVMNPSDPRSFPLFDTADDGFTYGTLDFTDFAAALEFLKSYSNTKIVSNPRVVVLNNQTANIQVGRDFPIPTFERNETTGSMVVSGYDYRELGIVLNVTPHINSAEEILVELQPEISSFVTMREFITGELAAPEFSVTKANTQVLIESGQTIAIGGLMSDNVATNETKVPYLGDIPLVGKLFRSKRQTSGDGNTKAETLFFVTVTMVDSEGQPVNSKVTDQDQTQGTANAAPAVDKSAEAGSAESSQSEMPKEEGAKAQNA